MRSFLEPLQIICADLGLHLIIDAVVQGVRRVGLGLASIFPDLAADPLASLEGDR